MKQIFYVTSHLRTGSVNVPGRCEKVERGLWSASRDIKSKTFAGGEGPAIFAERRLVSGFQNDKYLKLAANQRARSRVSRPAAHAFLVRALQELWQIGRLAD